ncbi:L,D-transpeptidase family protein [Rubritalea spongiae]|uniref:L,D-transpeptidase family protein n=1 Tax=Rubritalea spongiae TaxID=430797 RepID=A0ABW5DZ61_9BACT
MPSKASILRISGIATICILCYVVIINITNAKQSPISQLSPEEYADGEKRAAEAAKRVQPQLTRDLEAKGLKLGSPVFIRIFKQSRELEVWIENPETKKFTHFRNYPIAAMSGDLGPKLAEGDRQAPEGFYAVSRRLMHPRSLYHLAFNIGYPNRYDRDHHRTGSAIMVHGNRASIGCYAMTDEKIEEIYTLCDAALKNGQAFFRIHSYPFPLTEGKLQQHADHQCHSFWKELQPGFQHFETHNRPPNVLMENGNYAFELDS